MGVDVVLYEGEIGGNSGNIGGRCGARNTRVDVIGGVGFWRDEKMVKGGGLDYWKYGNWIMGWEGNGKRSV